RHVGYYLLDRGRRRLEIGFKEQPSFSMRLRHLREDHPAGVYLSLIAFLTVAILVPLTLYAVSVGATVPQIVLVVLLGLVPASAAAINLTNWLISRLVPPSFLPKMDFPDGIPADYR